MVLGKTLAWLKLFTMGIYDCGLEPPWPIVNWDHARFEMEHLKIEFNEFDFFCSR